MVRVSKYRSAALGLGGVAVLSALCCIALALRAEPNPRQLEAASRGNLVQIGDRNLRVPTGYGRQRQPVDPGTERPNVALFFGVAPSFEEPTRANQSAFKVPGFRSINKVLIVHPRVGLAENLIRDQLQVYENVDEGSKTSEDRVPGRSIASPYTADSEVIDYYTFEDGGYTTCNRAGGVIVAPSCDMYFENRGSIVKLTFSREDVWRQRYFRRAVEFKINSWDDLEQD